MKRPPDAVNRVTRFDPFVALAVLLGLGLVWAYWPTLAEMGRRWTTDPRYAHGYLVPAFSLALMWHRRGKLALSEVRPSAWGLPLIGAGLALRLAGARYYLGWVEGASLVPVLAGLALLVGGWRALRWSWPMIAFLIFMVPLPYKLEVALASPLQRVATKASTYALQTLGFPALSGGNVVQLDDVELNVVEACSGLSMLFTFIAMATGVAMVVDEQSRLEKVLIVASAVPIALFVNVVRITATGVLHETVGGRLANLVFHDLAGWLMMPMALGLLWLELALLAHLLVKTSAAPVLSPIGLKDQPQAAARPREAGREARRGGKPGAPSEALKRALRGS
jgi:exosortase